MDPPKAYEVRIKIVCTSLCHSDVTFWRMKVGPLPPSHSPSAVCPPLFLAVLLWCCTVLTDGRTVCTACTRPHTTRVNTTYDSCWVRCRTSPASSPGFSATKLAGECFLHRPPSPCSKISVHSLKNLLEASEGRPVRPLLLQVKPALHISTHMSPLAIFFFRR